MTLSSLSAMMPRKTLAEATQLLENVLVQSSKTTLTPETLKTKLREVLEKPQELSKENGKDDTELRVLEKPQELSKGEREEYTELRVFAERLNRLDAAVRLLQGAGSQKDSTARTSELRWRSRTKRARLTSG